MCLLSGAMDALSLRSVTPPKGESERERRRESAEVPTRVKSSASEVHDLDGCASFGSRVRNLMWSASLEMAMGCTYIQLASPSAVLEYSFSSASFCVYKQSTFIWFCMLGLVIMSRERHAMHLVPLCHVKVAGEVLCNVIGL